MGWFLRRFSLAKAVLLAISCGTRAWVEHLELPICESMAAMARPRVAGPHPKAQVLAPFTAE